MRKHKIIDTIFLYDEIEMLHFRLTELDEYVDEFVIMECEMDFKGNPKPLNYLENIDLFKKWKDKITYLPTPSITFNDVNTIYESISFTKKFNKVNDKIVGKDDIRFFQIITLIGILLEKPIGLDDLILISDVDEIPDLSKVSSFKPQLKFGVIVLRQTNFTWTTKYFDVIPNMGTIGFQFNRLVTNPEIVYKAYFNKLLPSNPDFEIIDNGYHLSHFYDLEKTISKLKLLHNENSEYDLSELDSRVRYSYENLTSIKTNSNEKIYNLIDYDGKLPKNIEGVGLALENFSLFPNEQEILLAPGKLKLISIDNNFKYYHPDINAVKSIKKKYEFEYIEPLNKLEKLNKTTNNNTNIYELPEHFSLISNDPEEKVIEFYRSVPIINEMHYFKLDKYVFQVFYFNKALAYKKYYFNNKSNCIHF
jgi:hypothetical protein